MESALDAYGRHRLLTFDRPGDPSRPSRSPTRPSSAPGTGSATGSTRRGTTSASGTRSRRPRRTGRPRAGTTASCSAGRVSSASHRGPRPPRSRRRRVRRRTCGRASSAGTRNERPRRNGRRGSAPWNGGRSAAPWDRRGPHGGRARGERPHGGRRRSAAKPEARRCRLATRRPPSSPSLGAQSLVEEDLDLSLLLARQAVAIDDLAPDPRLPARRAPAQQPRCDSDHARDRPAQSSFHQPRREDPGGDRRDGRASAVRHRDLRLIGNPLPLSNRLESVAYSPDGRTPRGRRRHSPAPPRRAHGRAAGPGEERRRLARGVHEGRVAARHLQRPAPHRRADHDPRRHHAPADRSLDRAGRLRSRRFP